MSTSLYFHKNAAWWLTGLVLLASCGPSGQNEQGCAPRAQLAPPRDTFDLVEQQKKFPTPSSISDSLRIPYAHQQRLLKGAYEIGGMLADSTTPNTYGGSACYYGQVRQLAQSSRASCHQVIYAGADEFEGYFLVIGYPNRPANLYLSGYMGSSYEDEQHHYTGDITKGIVLNDTTVLTKTGRTTYFFRRTKRPSYTDTISRRYHIDYRASRFVLLRRDSVRTYMPGNYFD